MFPKISVIMSAYNAEKYLEESINSILIQKDVSFELIVINDGSNDNTLSLLKNLSAKYDRIKIIDKQNEGLPVALNIGIKASMGTYIARMDADDIAEVNRLKMQADFLDRNGDIDILGTFVTAFGDDKERIWNFPITKEACDVALLFMNPLAHPTVMFRKSVAEHIGYYDTSFDYDQDYEYWARASALHGITNLPLPLVNYRIHEKQMGSVFSKSERISSQKRTQLFLLKEMGFSASEDEICLHVLLSNAYRLEFDMVIDLETLKKVRFYLIKMISANASSKRYSQKALAERCMIQYKALCLYSANLGMSVYKEFKMVAGILGLKSNDLPLLTSCILKFSRKQHLVIYNNLNKLKAAVKNVYD